MFKVLFISNAFLLIIVFVSALKTNPNNLILK